MRRSASTAPVFGMSLNALLLIGSIRSLARVLTSRRGFLPDCEDCDDGPFAKRRCILPADGYYEWQAIPVDGKKPRKQPFFIYRTDGGVLAFAGIYELWRDDAVPDDHEHAWLWTAAIITTQATDDVGQIHDRMPMVITRDHWADWLDPDNSEPGQLQAAMLPAMAGGGLTSHPVSSAVNSVRNNGPELIERLPADPADQERPPGELF